MPSSVIRSHSYDPEREELAITFTTGRCYTYYGVPPEAYQEFHFNVHIRDRYEFAEGIAQPADS